MALGLLSHLLAVGLGEGPSTAFGALCPFPGIGGPRDGGLGYMGRCPSPPGSELGPGQGLGRQNEGFLEMGHSDRVSGGGRHWNTRDQTVLGVGEGSWASGWTGIPASVTTASHWQLAAGASSSGLHDLLREGIGLRRE